MHCNVNVNRVEEEFGTFSSALLTQIDFNFLDRKFSVLFSVFNGVCKARENPAESLWGQWKETDGNKKGGKGS